MVGASSVSCNVTFYLWTPVVWAKGLEGVVGVGAADVMEALGPVYWGGAFNTRLRVGWE